jgi:cyclopropane fatty-acyl-phospholipid synthase-like methyltransferase
MEDKQKWEMWNRSRAPNYPHEKVIQFCLRAYPPEIRKGTVALDLGCGSGANSWFLAREGFVVVATDISRTGVQRTKERLGREGLQGEVRFERADSIGCHNESVDLVICVGVVEAVGPKAAVAVTAEVARVLRPGGRGLFLFAGEGDFRVQQATDLALHGFTRTEVDAMFARLFSRIFIDRYITTYENEAVMQFDWLVSVTK